MMLASLVAVENLASPARPPALLLGIDCMLWRKGYPVFTPPLPSAGRKGFLSPSSQDLESCGGGYRGTPKLSGAGGRKALPGYKNRDRLILQVRLSLTLFPNMQTLTSAPSAGWSDSLSLDSTCTRYLNMATPTHTHIPRGPPPAAVLERSSPARGSSAHKALRMKCTHHRQHC